MADWLDEYGVTLAAMESTVRYWKPIFYCLKEQLEPVREGHDPDRELGIHLPQPSLSLLKLRQQLPHDRRMMVIEPSGQRLGQIGDLSPQRAVRTFGHHRRVPLARDQRGWYSRDEVPVMFDATTDSLIEASSSSFSSLPASRVRSPISWDR